MAVGGLDLQFGVWHRDRPTYLTGSVRRFPPEVIDEDRHELLNAAPPELRGEPACIAQDSVGRNGAHPLREQTLDQLGRERADVPRLGQLRCARARDAMRA